MKKSFIFLCATLLTLTACNKEVQETPVVKDNDGVVLLFTSAKPELESNISTSAATKTAWDATTSSIVWQSSDKIRVGYTLDGDWMGQDAAGTAKFYASKEVTIDDSDSSVGTFQVPITGTGVTAFTDPATNGTYRFYAIYPSSILSSTTVSDPTAHDVTLATTQTPGVNTFDHATDIMVGASEDMVISGLPSDPIELNWNRVVAHTALTFSNMAFSGTETPTKITLTFNEDAKVAGSFSVNIADGTIGSGSANEIVLEGSGLVVDESSITTWATVLPVSFTSLNVEIKTNKATYTREITGLSKTFKKNARNTLTINMTTATRTAQAEYEWVKKNLSEISSSDVFVIVGNNGSNYAMSNGNGTTSAPSAVAVNVANNKLSVAPADNIQWQLSVNSGSYTFYPIGSTTTWLYCTSGTGNKVRVGTTTTRNTFTLDATSGYLKTTDNNYLGVYNSQDWRVYASTTTGNIADQTFAFYVKSNPDTREDAELSFATTSFEANIGDDFTAPTLTNPHSLTVTYSSSDENLALVDENTGEVVIGNDEGTVTITATFAGDQDYKLGTASYTITISDPNATGNDGSLAHPYTVEEALAAAGELATGGQSDNEVYISGIISTVSSYYSNYKSITYYISDDGTTSGQFEVYSGKGLEGADFSAITDLAVGDEVTVKGYLKNYNGTLEVYQNNQIVAINYATRYTITVNSATNGTITASAASAGAQGLITLTATPNSGYELDEWIVKDASDNDVTVTNNQFTMPASNVTVSASFKTASGKTYTILWNSTNNSKGNSSYTDTWTVTSNGLTCNMANWNNNSNGWTNSSGNGQIKCGRRNNASVATIITSTALSEAIKTVTITIDALTTSSINSIKLYSSSDNSSWTEEGSFTKSTGDQSVTISSPTSNKYYKLEFDCASGSSNGLLTLSKLVLTTN